MAELRWRVHSYRTFPDDFYLIEDGDNLYLFGTNRDTDQVEIDVMERHYKHVSDDETYEYLLLATEAFCASEDELNSLWEQYA